MPTAETMLEVLAREILTLAREKQTGTLRVRAVDDRTKLFFFQQGHVADLDTGRGDTLLEAALIDTGALTEKDIKRARKASQKSETPLGAALLDLGVVADDAVEESIRRRLTEEICEVFEWPLAEVQFFEHQADERIENFYSELADYYEVLADPEEVFLEAARRMDRWDLVRMHFSMLLDVFYATPAGFQYFREQARFPNEYAILSTVDGIKDVEEVINESSVDRFLAVNIVRRLRARGELELINPVQMFQLGVECSNGGKFDKACKLFRRAHERGLDDFDLQLKLAHALDAAGHKEEALRRYMEFCEKCFTQDRMEDAAKCLRRVVKLAPEDLPAQERLLEALLRLPKSSETVDQAIIIAERKAAAGKAREGLGALLRVKAVQPEDAKLRQKIIDLAEACRDHALARTEREALARLSHERKDVETELEVSQKLFCDGDDSLDVRVKLAELHLARGNRAKAFEHITSILNMPDKYKVKDESTLLLLHEAVCEIKPADMRSNRWLAEYHKKQGNKEKAVQVLQAWITNLERDGDAQEIIHAYERLLAIDDRYEHRWGLGMAFDKLGRVTESRRELRSLANLALRKREFEQAAKALDFILKGAPLDLETRKMQADLLEAKEDRVAASRKNDELGLLSILSGNIQDAEQFCRRLGPESPEAGENIRRLGRLCFEQGDRQKAVEQLVKSAKMHLEHKNYGLCRLALDECIAADPGHAEAASVLAELKARLEPPPPPAVEKAPAPVPGRAEPEPAAPEKKAKEAPRGKEAPRPVETAVEPPAPSPHLTYERQPFEPTKPLVTKVSGITAKLKRLKTAGPEEGSGSPKTIKSNVKNITAKLRSVKEGGDAEATEAAEAAPAAASVPEAAPAAESAPAAAKKRGSAAVPKPQPAQLRSAASRLKALAEKKEEEASVPAGGDEADGEAAAMAALEGMTAGKGPQADAGAAPAPAGAGARMPASPAAVESPERGGAHAEEKKTQMGNLASRLAALRKDAPGAAAAGQEGTPTGEAPGSAPAAANKKLKLNSSASKLADLRKKPVAAG